MNRKKAIAITLFGFFIMVNSYPSSALANGGGGRGGHQGPPQEAFSACEGKSEGDTASFESDSGETITGTCRQDRNGDRLLLIPDNALQGRGSQKND